MTAASFFHHLRARAPKAAAAGGKTIWTAVNSPLAIAIVTGVLIANIARDYGERDEAAKDLVVRAEKMDAGLMELHQRTAALRDADSQWKGRCDYRSASKIEWDVITGGGDYQPTKPEYKHVNIMVILAEVNRTSGVLVSTIELTNRMSLYTRPPPYTAKFVRSDLDWLQDYVRRRALLVATGALPLRRGEEVSPQLERALGYPSLEEMERAMAVRRKERAAHPVEFDFKPDPPCPWEQPLR